MTTTMIDQAAPTKRMHRGDLGVGLLAAAVAFDFYGFYDGFFERAWADVPIVPVPLLSYAFNASLVLWLPFAARTDRHLRTTQRLAELLAVWSLVGVVLTPLLAPAVYSLAPAGTVVLCTAAAWSLRRRA